MQNNKIRVQPNLKQETFDKLKEDAEKAASKPSPYAAKIIENYYEGKKESAPNRSKKEYGQ